MVSLDLYTQNIPLTQKAKFWTNYVSSLKGELSNNSSQGPSNKSLFTLGERSFSARIRNHMITWKALICIFLEQFIPNSRGLNLLYMNSWSFKFRQPGFESTWGTSQELASLCHWNPSQRVPRAQDGVQQARVADVRQAYEESSWAFDASDRWCKW